MATISKLSTDLTAKGFTQVELEDADARLVVRNFFRTGNTYGGAEDKVGKWEPKRIGFYIFVDTTTKKRVYPTDPEIVEIAKANGGLIEKGKTYTLNGATVLCETKSVVWQCAYCIGDAFQDGLSKSYLLNDTVVDADNNVVKFTSTIREWANANIINGKLDKEWAGELATLLNDKGLTFEEKAYTRKRKDGGAFAVRTLVPHFAK